MHWHLCKPVFHVDGTVTAGNASQMSDAGAAVILMSEARAEAEGYDPLARFVGYATAGVSPEIMGIGPVPAIPKALASTGLTLSDIDVIELNEAFAVQTLAVIQEAQLPPEKVNVNGGAVALGHPLGCTGTKLTVSLINEMRRQNHRYGMVTMCVGGGHGCRWHFQFLIYGPLTALTRRFLIRTRPDTEVWTSFNTQPLARNVMEGGYTGNNIKDSNPAHRTARKN